MSTITFLRPWAVRLPAIAAAIILLQTLFFKFTGAPESVYIFTTLGMEPVGRIGSGVAELAAAVLLAIPAWSWLGAALGVGIMSGAILSHLTVLGIPVQGDGGLLFALAVTVFALCAWVLIQQRYRVLLFVQRMMGRPQRT
jgi:hypothetical protein